MLCSSLRFLDYASTPKLLQDLFERSIVKLLLTSAPISGILLKSQSRLSNGEPMNRAISPMKRAISRSLYLSGFISFLLPSLALAEEVSVGVPIAKGTPGDRNGYVNGTGYQPYQPPQVNSGASPQGANRQNNSQDVPMPPNAPLRLTQEEAAIAFQALDPAVQAEAKAQAMEAATKRAKGLSWLLMTPGAASWFGAGVYLNNLFGTTDAAPAYATGFGAELTLWPTPWAVFAKGRVGGLYQMGLSPAGAELTNFRRMALDAEGTAGYLAAGIVGFRLGWYGTRQTWDVATVETTSINSKTTVAAENVWQHGAVFGLSATLRGVTFEGTCRVAAASLYDAVGKLTSGTTGQCGIGLSGTMFAF
jgi:hypothetical protein